jgi:tetratricopeptide (TPR) repeat protein
MTPNAYLDVAYFLIRMLLAVALLVPAGCGSRPTGLQGPPVDQDLHRTGRAARTAFESGRIQQAAALYRQTLERAYLRDDLAAVIDARYNLALCLTLLHSDREALELILQTREDLSRAGQPTPADILLLEATILYRQGRSPDAWQITESILQSIDAIPSAVKNKTHFLRGLIATERGDPTTLQVEIAALAESNSPIIQADREELMGHLALTERRWDAAVSAFDEAAVLRRQNLDYRAMVNALAKAGEACRRAGRPVAASSRYLRAGQSAALQGNSDQARIWLTLAAQLAERGGDDILAQEARLQLARLPEKQPPAAAGMDAAPHGP